MTKRLRLTNHFFRQYFKLVRREISMAQISETTLRNFANKEVSIDALIVEGKRGKPKVDEHHLTKHYEKKLAQEE